MRGGGERAGRPAVDGDDPVARLEAGVGGRGPGFDRGDLRRGPLGLGRAAADGEDDEEDRERDEDVRERARGDDGNALPRRGAPVRVARCALLHVAERPLRRPPRARGEVCGSDLTVELRIRPPRSLEVLDLEGAPDGPDGRREARLLAHRGLDEHL